MSTIAVQNNVISSGNPTSVDDPIRSTSPEDINPLKLFLLERTKEYEIDYEKDSGSGETVSAVVNAYSAVEARQILQDHSVDLSFREVQPEPDIILEFWTRDVCAKCVELGVVTCDLSPGVVNVEYV